MRHHARRPLRAVGRGADGPSRTRRRASRGGHGRPGPEAGGDRFGSTASSAGGARRVSRCGATASSGECGRSTGDAPRPAGRGAAGPAVPRTAPLNTGAHGSVFDPGAGSARDGTPHASEHGQGPRHRDAALLRACSARSPPLPGRSPALDTADHPSPRWCRSIAVNEAGARRIERSGLVAEAMAHTGATFSALLSPGRMATRAETGTQLGRRTDRRGHVVLILPGLALRRRRVRAKRMAVDR